MLSGNVGVCANGIAAGVYGASTTSTGVIGISTSYIGVYGSGGATGVTGVSSESAREWLRNPPRLGPWTLMADFDRDWSLAGSASGWAAWFNGNVDVDGNLSKAGGSFKIDHPLDPANKYLYHSFVESPEHDEHLQRQRDHRRAGRCRSSFGPEWFLNFEPRFPLSAHRNRPVRTSNCGH